MPATTTHKPKVVRVAGFMPHTVFDCVFSNQSCRVFAFPNGLKSWAKGEPGPP